MARLVSAPDARRRSDDAVRRIRDESAQRIGGQRRRRAVGSWCALATLAGTISLAALEVRNERIREEVRPTPAEASIPGPCAALAKTLAESDKRLFDDRRRAKTFEEVTSARARRAAIRKAAFQAAGDRCPSMTPQYSGHDDCGGVE